MNQHSIYNPEHWRRFDRDLNEIYQDLVEHYNIAVGGEIVEQFSDKGTVHSYIDFYERELRPTRGHTRLLEIGMMTGASLKLWSEYFAYYELVGIDLRAGWNREHPWQADIESDPNIELHFGIDSTATVPDLGDPFKIIIDDGAHDWPSQFATFKNYWPHLVQNGVYYIEDVENRDSLEQLIKAIAEHLAGSTIGVSIHAGNKNGRADDMILVVKKL